MSIAVNSNDLECFCYELEISSAWGKTEVLLVKWSPGAS